MGINLRIKKELAFRELERRKIKEDQFYFVENYVYIENKENTEKSNKVLFVLWEGQKKAWISIDRHKKNVIIKARQIGITWLVLARGLRNLLKIKGYKILIMSQTQDYAQDAIERVEFMLMHLPSWFCREQNTSKKDNNMGIRDIYIYKKTAKEIKIWHPIPDIEGEVRQTSVISARPSTKSAGRSLTADEVIFDEWAYHEFANTVFAGALPTIDRVDDNSGKFIGLSTNQRGTFFEQIVKTAKEKDFNLIFLSVWTDPNRTKEWYEKAKKTSPDSYMQEYPETLEQALSAGERTAFPEFDNSIHVCKQFDIPDHWIKWGSVDNGYNDPYAWYKYAINEDGTVFVYYEMSRDKKYDKQLHYAEQGVKFMESCQLAGKKEELNFLLNYKDTDKPQVEPLKYIVAGRDAWNTHHRDESGKCLVDYYREGVINPDGTRKKGVPYGFIKPITDRKLRMATMHHYLKPYDIEIMDEYGKIKIVKTAKLQIMENCQHLIKTIPLLVKDKYDQEKVEDDSTIDNPYDSLGYGLISWHTEKTKGVTEKETKSQVYKRLLMTGANKRKRGIVN